MRLIENRIELIRDDKGAVIGTRPPRDFDVTDEAVLYRIHEVLRKVPAEYYFQAFKWYQFLRKHHQKQTAAEWQRQAVALLQEQMRAVSVWIVAKGGKHTHDIIEQYVDEVVAQ